MVSKQLPIYTSSRYRGTLAFIWSRGFSSPLTPERGQIQNMKNTHRPKVLDKSTTTKAFEGLYHPHIMELKPIHTKTSVLQSVSTQSLKDIVLKCIRHCWEVQVVRIEHICVL